MNTIEQSQGLGRLLNPTSIAIVGASATPGKIGNAVVRTIASSAFSGAIWPINERAAFIEGLPASTSLAEVDIDDGTLLFVVLPEIGVVPALRQGVALGVRQAVVVTSDTSENGQLRRDLAGVVAETGMSVLGPNTSGFLNVPAGLVARIGHNGVPVDELAAGGTLVVGQSGSCVNIVANRAMANGIGLQYSIDVGDAVDVSIEGVLAYATQVPEINNVLLIVENVANGKEIVDAVRRLVRNGRSCVALVLGTTAAGARATSSHVGAVAGDAAVVRQLLSDAGAIVVDNLDALWEVGTVAVHWQRRVAASFRSTPAAPRLGVVALSGGEAALMADLLANQRMPLASFSPAPSTLKEIRASYPFLTMNNPLDLTGHAIVDGDLMRRIIIDFATVGEFSHLAICAPILGIGRRGSVAQAIVNSIDALGIPAAVSWWTLDSRVGDVGIPEILRSAAVGSDRNPGFPLFSSSHQMARSLTPWFAAEVDSGVDLIASKDGRLHASSTHTASPLYTESRDILASLGFKYPRSIMVTATADSASESVRSFASSCINGVVVKADVPSATHKRAGGLVATSMGLDSDVSDTIERVRGAAAAQGERGCSIVLEELVPGDLHLFVGCRFVQGVGYVTVFGQGGGLVETNFNHVIGQLKYTPAAKLLGRHPIGNWLRREWPASADLLGEWITTLSESIEKLKIAGLDCTEIEVNPIIISSGTGQMTAVDARMIASRAD